jgi:tetratricopeptide (TPR) repeat protein
MSADRNPVVYFLLHLPRTGGTTIEEHLRTHLPSGRLWVPSPPTSMAMLCGHRYRPEAPADLAQVRVVAGHFLARSVARHFPGREIRKTVLLRDPVGFHVSLYNYHMMLAASRGRQTCSFDRHLRMLPRDPIAISLLWQWLELPPATLLRTSDAQKYDMLNEALADFWFVASYRDGDRLVAALADDLAVPPVAARKNTALDWQKRVRWQPLRGADLPATTQQAILARNPIHDALWHNWCEAGFAGDRGAAPPPRQQPLPPPPRSGSGEIGLRELLRAGWLTVSIRGREWDAGPPWSAAVRAGQAGRWPRAAELFRRALRRVPQFPEVWVQYGHALLEAGDVAGAAAAYRRATELDGELADAYLRLGHALRLQGRGEEARAAYLRFERLDPAGLQRQRDALLARGWSEEAVSSAWRALTGSPG